MVFCPKLCSDPAAVNELLNTSEIIVKTASNLNLFLHRSFNKILLPLEIARICYAVLTTSVVWLIHTP